MKRVLMGAISVTLASGISMAGEQVELKTENDKINYIVGYRLGGDFKRQEVEIKSDALLQGIDDATGGGKPLLTEQEMGAVLTSLATRVKAAQMEKQKKQGAENIKAGAAFLAD
ncbi:MAG: FKBP-type peptidyl-prolyl cis-trans isomerase N-terminal domain-containing protein, partial [Gammaproteobacteria bacterium]|nr:FKBP-type peptidyl-prolyl cis-trans isomerase N-terminal domain-containing protein [Gammaproteobacteria bacterium]